MATTDITSDNLQETLENHDMIVLDFWATWCGPCRQIAPVFEALSEEHTNIVFGKVNADDQSELAAQYGVRGIPTLLFIKNKEVIETTVGALPRSKLEAAVATLLNAK